MKFKVFIYKKKKSLFGLNRNEEFIGELALLMN
jgi:hypothetical protein